MKLCSGTHFEVKVLSNGSVIEILFALTAEDVMNALIKLLEVIRTDPSAEVIVSSITKREYFRRVSEET